MIDTFKYVLFFTPVLWRLCDVVSPHAYTEMLNNGLPNHLADID